MKKGQKEEDIRHGGSEESDSETIEQSSCSYEHLMNEIKMKSMALSKASNLIEILQIEVPISAHRQLEVQKNAKEEAIIAAQQQLHRKYEAQIADLCDQIRILQATTDKHIIHSTDRQITHSTDKQVTHSTDLRRKSSRILPRSQSMSLHRSRSKEKSPINQNTNLTRTSELSLEVKMYRKWIIQTQVCETNIMDFLINLTEEQNKEIQTYLESAECQECEFFELARIQFDGSKTRMRKMEAFENQVKQLMNVVSAQNQTICNMKIYQTNLEETIKAINKKLPQLSEEKAVYSAFHLQERQEIQSSLEKVLRSAKKWKQINAESSGKIDKLQGQNSQLRSIIEQMINLMKKKRISTDYT